MSTAERPVGKKSAVFPCKRNSLSYTLVDDVAAHSIDIGFTAAVVATLDGLVEKTIDRVIVILVILGSIYTSLRRDRVRTARRIADAENFYIITELTQRSSCRRTTESGSDDNDFEFPLVARIDNTDLRLMLCPFLRQRTLRNLRN